MSEGPSSLLMALVAFLLAASLLERLAVCRKRARACYQPKVLLIRTLILTIIYGFWFGLTDRPITALLLALATVIVFVASSRAKEHLLGEPLVFLDLQFIGQILRHPRLYYAQLLLAPRNAVAAGVFVTGFGALLFFLARMESPLDPPLRGAVRTLLLVGPFLLWAIPRQRNCAGKIRTLLGEPADELRPQVATDKWGIFAPMLAHYARWVIEGSAPTPTRKFARLPTGSTQLPHVLAVQCESFIDPRRIFVDAPELPEFQAAKSDASAHGSLDVPCGGAYTMRTEFSFLTGLSPESLGCDRFNPYARAERREYPSLAKTLKEAGYETDFVHPHGLRFFRRDAVMPALGFDRLHGDAKFQTAPRCGPHVSDAAVAAYLGQLLEKSKEPRFVFAVTMENHGPWFPGRLPDCNSGRDAYLNHLVNSDRMLGMLTALASRLDRRVVICWYGDHSPILDYDIAHERPPQTDYLITTNEPSRSSAPRPSTLSAHDLPSGLLSVIESISKPEDTPWNRMPREMINR